MLNQVRLGILGVTIASAVILVRAQGQERVLLPITTDGHSWGYADESGTIVIPPKFQAALPFTQGLAAVKVDGKYGFIDTHGTFTILPRFTNAKWFAGNLASVQEGSSWTYVDRQGQSVLKEKIDDAGWFDPGTGLAPVKVGSKWGYINQRGTPVITPQFDESYSFHDGLAPVKIDGKFGFVDTKGAMAIAAKYDHVLIFNEDKAAVDMDGRWGYVDSKGKLFIPTHFNSAGSFRQGMAQVVDGGQQVRLHANGNVTSGTTTTFTLISYHIGSNPPGAAIYAVPLVDWLKIQKTNWTLASLWEYRDGSTNADLDFFDQKYMLVLTEGTELRFGMLDVIPKATNHSLTITF
jgi:hypothetical protein